MNQKNGTVTVQLTDPVCPITLCSQGDPRLSKGRRGGRFNYHRTNIGQPEDTFDQYERQVRREYEWMTDEGFIGTDCDFTFLPHTTTIYSTHFFQTKYAS